jgi:hypothetical protein
MAGVGLAVVLFALFVAPAVWAQTAPPLGVASQFGALGSSAVTGATGSGVVVEGDVGSTPTSTISNFPPSTVDPLWFLHLTDDGVVQDAAADAQTAYTNLAGQGPATEIPDGLSTTLGPGVYSFETGAPDLGAGETLTLNGDGVFIFLVGSSLTANVGSMVTGTADACNVFWQVTESATLNGGNFWGTVIANTSITLGAGANLQGRALALNGAVTMSGSGGNRIEDCATEPGEPMCEEITLTPTLPDGQVGVAYDETIFASGGVAPYTFTVEAGALPGGVTLNPNGNLTGTPSGEGGFTFTIRATDQLGCFEEVEYTIDIEAATEPPDECPEITLLPVTLPEGQVGVAYSQTITGNNGTPPYTFGVISGTLPAGLTLMSDGDLTGTPTTPGSPQVTIQGMDAVGCLATIVYTIVIEAATEPPDECPDITLSPSSLPQGQVGVAYNQMIQGNGGTAPYTFGVLSGTLPTGLILMSNGNLTGTPTVPGSPTVTIRGMDANGCPATIVYTIVINPAPPPPEECPVVTLSPATLPAASMGVFYSQTIIGSGPNQPFVFGVTVGTLPPGLTLLSTGLLSGTPTGSGASAFTIRGTDSEGCFAEIQYSISVPQAVPTLPEVFALMLALGLGWVGYSRLRRRRAPAYRGRS